MVYLHVLCFQSEEVYTYACERTHRGSPAMDLWQMLEWLGTIWHSKRKRTGKRYVATNYLLEQANQDEVSPKDLKPSQERRLHVRKKSLKAFKLTSSDLLSSDAEGALKAAYRREAKIHHPDAGGDAAVFRKIYEAHQELLQWIKNPKFTSRRGIPGKWSYDRQRGNRWLPPSAWSRA